MANVLIERGGQTVGPFTPDELRDYLADGSLQAHSPAWTEGLLDWAPLEQVLARLKRQPDHGEAPEFTDLAGRCIMPDEARGFSWGAFLCGPLWGFPYRVWVSVLSWVPGIGALMWLWLGLNGRELAWRARDWPSVQAFRQSERRWTTIGVVLFLLLLLAQTVLVVWLMSRGELPRAAPEAAPTTQQPAGPTPSPAEPAQPAQPAATPPPAAAVAPQSRAAWRRQLMNKPVDQVTALLGEPAHVQRLEKQQTLVLIYQNLSYEKTPAMLDEYMLVGVQGTVVRGVEFVQKGQ